MNQVPVLQIHIDLACLGVVHTVLPTDIDPTAVLKKIPNTTPHVTLPVSK